MVNSSVSVCSGLKPARDALELGEAANQQARADQEDD